MKLFKLILLFLAGAFAISSAAGQANAALNIVMGNAGTTNLGGTNLLQITVNNTGPTSSIGVYKVRVQVSVPTAICEVAPFALQTGLPSGWTITSQTAGGIFLSNGTDVIPVGAARNIFIVINGTALGGPSSINAGLTFSNGIAPGTGFGSLAGDNPLDNTGLTSITVQPAPACALGVSAAAGTIACNGGTTTLTATPSGALGAIEYSITGGAPFQAGNTFTVPAGSYTVTAREVTNTSCTATSTSVVVGQPTPVVASAVITTPIPSVGGTGAITVSSTGGTAGTTIYDITSGTSSSNTTGDATGAYTGLLAGTYTFTVTKAGCPAVTAPLVLADPAACILTGVTVVPGTILCNGGTTTLTATAVPAGPTYQYSLNGGAFQASNVFTGVAAGAYSVIAREVSNPVCSQTATGTLSQPAILAATATVSTAIAVPGGTGTITVTTTGGTGTKTFVITSGTTINATGATSGIFTSLLAGSYSFTVTDANTCTTTATVNLPSPGIATADPAVGQMFFTTTGGAVQSANTLLLAPAADLYDINIPFYNLNQLNPVPNGTINFTINLGSKLVLAPGFNLATAPLSAYFTFTSAVVGANVVITGTQIAAIPADFDAIAKFRVKGDSACRSNVVSNIIITNILQTLSDDVLLNNQATLQYTLPITLTKAQVNVTCNGAANGSINFVVSSGTTVVTTGPSYTNTTPLASGVNNFTLNNLAPGVYTTTVTAASDATLGSCSLVVTTTILQPTVVTLPVASISSTNNNCFNATAGSITVVATGGTSPYTYTIAGPTVNTTGANSGAFTGLAAGSYTVTVTDNNGCTATTAAIIITQPVGGIPDITLGSDISGSLFATPGVTQTVVYNVAEINGNSAVGDTIRITKVAGFTINFNPTIFSVVVGSGPGATTYALDNPRWKIDNTNPAFVSIILTDPANPGGPGTLLCNQLVNVAVTITRNTSNISTFPLSARLRQANGETALSNNFNSVVLTAD
ncbi:MAG: SprB repeat-containing protein [Rhizobacter sp.]|nr:SprB repeat-containing protein [Ferruginibacter sp.]